MRYLGLCFLLFLPLVSACRNSGDLLYQKDLAPANEVTAVHNIRSIESGGEVDILWVIDNSGSMLTYQQSVQSNTSLFISALVAGHGLDWKIGMLSTDTRDRPYLGFTPANELNVQTANPTTLFNSAVARLGTRGDGIEKTYLPIIKNLTAYPNFLRKDAYLAIVLVSDAPEQSPTSTKDFIKFLSTVKGGTDKILFYGVLCPSEWCPSTDDTPWTLPGSKFEELTKAIKSKLYKICDVDYGKNLSDIGKDISSRAGHPKIFLSGRPKTSTIRVFFKGQELLGGEKDIGGFWIYNYDSNAVVFHDLNFAPGDLEYVKIDFTEDDGKS